MKKFEFKPGLRCKNGINDTEPTPRPPAPHALDCRKQCVIEFNNNKHVKKIRAIIKNELNKQCKPCKLKHRCVNKYKKEYECPMKLALTLKEICK
jgi:hypothetical protein